MNLFDIIDSSKRECHNLAYDMTNARNMLRRGEHKRALDLLEDITARYMERETFTDADNLTPEQWAERLVNRPFSRNLNIADKTQWLREDLEFFEREDIKKLYREDSI